MKKYMFEGKTEEEVILKALKKELGVKEDELFYNISEEKVGLLKRKNMRWMLL